MKNYFTLFCVLLLRFCFSQQDTIITERIVYKKVTKEIEGETYQLKSRTVGNFIVKDGKRFYTYDTLDEFILDKGDFVKYVALTPQGKVAMKGQFEIVMIGTSRTMQKSGTWKYYDQFGKLLLTRKEKNKNMRDFCFLKNGSKIKAAVHFDNAQKAYVCIEKVKTLYI